MIFGCACALLSAAQTISTQTTPDLNGHTVKASAGEVFQIADLLVGSGQIEKAHSILHLLSSDPDADVRHEAKFRRAKLLEKQGRTAAAALLLRQILDENPSAVAARLHLAAALSRMGEETAALRELRALRSVDLPGDVAIFVDQVMASLLKAKPFGVHVEVALAPDTNVNRATSSDMLGTIFGDFTLNPDARAKSGIGIAVRALSRASFPLSGKAAMQARATQEANLYRKAEFNDVTFGFLAGPKFPVGKGQTAVESGTVVQWFGSRRYQRVTPLSVSLTHPIGSAAQLGVEASGRGVKNYRNDLQSGRGLSARLRYEQAVSPRAHVLGSLGLDRYAANDEAYSTRSWSAGLAASRQAGRMTMTLEAEFGKLGADERFAIIPDVRQDTFLRLQLGSVLRQLAVGGFAPLMRLSIERNRSTVEFYDYRRLRTEIGVGRAF
jgi:tetratricopeptide (TPR) repeat protein